MIPAGTTFSCYFFFSLLHSSYRTGRGPPNSSHPQRWTNCGSWSCYTCASTAKQRCNKSSPFFDFDYAAPPAQAFGHSQLACETRRAEIVYLAFQRTIAAGKSAPVIERAHQYVSPSMNGLRTEGIGNNAAALRSNQPRPLTWVGVVDCAVFWAGDKHRDTVLDACSHLPRTSSLPHPNWDQCEPAAPKSASKLH